MCHLVSIKSSDVTKFLILINTVMEFTWLCHWTLTVGISQSGCCLQRFPANLMHAVSRITMDLYCFRPSKSQSIFLHVQSQRDHLSSFDSLTGSMLAATWGVCRTCKNIRYQFSKNRTELISELKKKLSYCTETVRQLCYLFLGWLTHEISAKCGYSWGFLDSGALNNSGVVNDGNFLCFSYTLVQKLRLKASEWVSEQFLNITSAQ